MHPPNLEQKQLVPGLFRREVGVSSLATQDPSRGSAQGCLDRRCQLRCSPQCQGSFNTGSPNTPPLGKAPSSPTRAPTTSPPRPGISLLSRNTNTQTGSQNPWQLQGCVGARQGASGRRMAALLRLPGVGPPPTLGLGRREAPFTRAGLQGPPPASPRPRQKPAVRLSCTALRPRVTRLAHTRGPSKDW